jgi:hypothetical protein
MQDADSAVHGRSSKDNLPLYRQLETPIDKAWLEVTRRHAVEFICAVVNSVTHMGFQFPGSSGPGIPIWDRSKA